MATQELWAGSALNTTVQFWLRYDDVTLVIDRLRWKNTSGRTFEVRFRKSGNETKVTIPAANENSRALPPGTIGLVPVVDAETGEVTLMFDGDFGFGTTSIAGAKA